MLINLPPKGDPFWDWVMGLTMLAILISVPFWPSSAFGSDDD